MNLGNEIIESQSIEQIFLNMDLDEDSYTAPDSSTILDMFKDDFYTPSDIVKAITEQFASLNNIEDNEEYQSARELLEESEEKNKELNKEIKKIDKRNEKNKEKSKELRKELKQVKKQNDKNLKDIENSDSLIFKLMNDNKELKQANKLLRNNNQYLEDRAYTNKQKIK